ncbi:MAG: hypothetical protein ACFFFH_00110 [Candidatus Thorarchaeota archaeon]
MWQCHLSSYISNIVDSSTMGDNLYNLLMWIERIMAYNNIITTIGKYKKKILKGIIIAIYIIVISPIAIFGLWIIYTDLRPAPKYEYDEILNLTHWTVVPAGKNPATQHNSNTDLIYYNGFFYLVHAQTKWHLKDTNGALVIWRSPDAKEDNWEEITRVTVPNTDVRDPKFADINGRLFLYFLPNWNFDPGPNTTFYTYSDNGFLDNYPEPKELEVNVTYNYKNGTINHVVTGGWNLWRPKTNDNITWYVIASGRKFDQQATTEYEADVVNTITVLLKTADGFNWTEVTEVYTEWGNGEACLEFLPNQEMLSTHRVGTMGKPGYAFGNPDACTMIGTSANNFSTWSFTQDRQTRLDGSTLFTLEGRIFAVGRNHPESRNGDHFFTKRTAFYEVTSNQLIHLFDLPSNGDTAYTGVVVKDGWVYACYYTNPINKDLPWFVGLAFLPKSDIRMAKVSANGLIAFADQIGGE